MRILQSGLSELTPNTLKLTRVQFDLTLKIMSEKPQWFLIKTEQDYEAAIARYEKIKNTSSGTEHQEKLLLAHLISAYENEQWDLPDFTR